MEQLTQDVPLDVPLANLKKIIEKFENSDISDRPNWTDIIKAFQEAKALDIEDTILGKIFATMYTFQDTFQENRLYTKLSELPYEKFMFLFDKIGRHYHRQYSCIVYISYYESYLVIELRYVNYIHEPHRVDGPTIVKYDIDWNILEESYLVFREHEHMYSSFDNCSIFHRPYIEGPAFQSKIASSMYRHVEFYAEEDIVLRQPHMPSITLKFADGAGEINVHTGSLGEVLYLNAIGLDFKFVEFEISYPVFASQLFQFLNQHKYRYGVVGIFKKIIWSDGVIYQRNGNDIYVALFPDGHLEYFYDIYTYDNIYGHLGFKRNEAGKYLEPDYSKHYLSKSKVDYLVDCPRVMGIRHRVEFRRDEKDGSEYLQPAIEYPDNPDLNEYWVNGKQVSWNWAPKRSTSKQVHKKHTHSSRKHHT